MCSRFGAFALGSDLWNDSRHKRFSLLGLIDLPTYGRYHLIPMTSPYVREPPSPQQTLDVFAGKWASRFPGKFANLKAGTNLLFEDPKITP